MVSDASLFPSLRFSKWVSLVSLVLILSACGASNQIKQVDNLKSIDGQAKIVMMPLDVELSKLTAAGLLEPNAEWTENAKTHMKKSIASLMQRKNIKLNHYDNLDNDPASVPVQLEKLHQAVGASIEYASFLPLPSRDPKAIWTLGSDAKLLKEKTGADYAIFFLLEIAMQLEEGWLCLFY